MEPFNLEPNESVIVKEKSVAYKDSGTLTDELVLTNLSTIVIRKGFFGKVKEVLYFPHNQIINNDGKPNVEVSKINSCHVLVIGFQHGNEVFSLQSDRKRAQKFASSLTEVLTGVKTKKSILSKVRDFASDPLSGTIEGLEKATEKISTAIDEKRNKLFEKKPGTEILVVDVGAKQWREAYSILDENQVIKYTCDDTLLSRKRYMSIYDSGKKEVAKVVERNKHGTKYVLLSNWTESDGITGKRQKYKVKRKLRLHKGLFKVSNSNWRVESNLVGTKFTIFKGKEVVATIASSSLYTTYLITFYDKKNELMLIKLFVTARSSMSSSKADKKELHKKQRRSGSLLSLFNPFS